MRELYGHTSAQLFLCNWYKVLSDVEREIFDDPGDHAGEMETSFVLAYFPELVARRAGRYAWPPTTARTAATKFDAVNRGWVSITRPWHLLTTNSGAGNPHAATAEKGHAMMKLLVERLSQFLVDLSAAPLDERFPY